MDKREPFDCKTFDETVIKTTKTSKAVAAPTASTSALRSTSTIRTKTAAATTTTTTASKKQNMTLATNQVVSTSSAHDGNSKSPLVNFAMGLILWKCRAGY